MTPAQLNYAEAGLWMLVAAVMAAAALKREPRARRLGLTAAAALILFAGSDLIEAHTGAWWSPWWLLLWKAGCLGVILYCALGWRRIQGGSKS